MALTIKWINHIEAWQHSSLKQSEYCRQQGLNDGRSNQIEMCCMPSLFALGKINAAALPSAGQTSPNT
ncbi:MAG: IS66 family insertion sequence element accessory protein TnpA [Methylobacter sp.]